jgi:purine-binding chemotaxis protein CheW
MFSPARASAASPRCKVPDAPRRDTSLPEPLGARTPGGRRELARAADPNVLEEYIGFRAAEETFALPLAVVREILKPPPITEVPRARPDILGILSVRGQITTVLDLRRRLGFPAQELTPFSRILLVEGREEILGLMVDQVTQVYRLSHLEIEAAGSVLGGEFSTHVAGIGRPRIRGLRGEAMQVSDEVLILLDLTALLAF